MRKIINYQQGFKTKVNAERPMLMMPMNVVMTARIDGMINKDTLQSAMEALRKRHALLAVRVVFDDENVAWYITDGVPEIPVKAVTGETAVPEELIKEDWMTPFSLETGPLVRITLIENSESCELIVTGHHVICDGTSLTYLISDILKQTSGEDISKEILPAPPPIDESTVPNPKKMNFIARLVMDIISKKWLKEKITFNSEDRERMLKKFWEQNNQSTLLRWKLGTEQTSKLVACCRQENVTVNSALWSAFLAAQHEQQGEIPAFRRRIGLAVSTRNKLKLPVGKAFGFYASSLSLNMKYNARNSFWTNTRSIHTAIKKEISKTDIFRMLNAQMLPASLLDSLYFAKYDGLKNKLANNMLQRMNWDKISYGYSITNVGRVDIPVNYGKLTLKEIYGPILYSDVNEKVVGITTVSGRLTFSLSSNRNLVNQETLVQIQKKVMGILQVNCIN